MAEVIGSFNAYASSDNNFCRFFYRIFGNKL